LVVEWVGGWESWDGWMGGYRGMGGWVGCGMGGFQKLKSTQNRFWVDLILANGEFRVVVVEAK